MERIKSAAIRQGIAIYVGKSHSEIIINTGRTYRQIIFDDFHEKGFVTSNDRFVSRREAAKIAYAARQIGEPVDSLQSYHLELSEN